MLTQNVKPRKIAAAAAGPESSSAEPEATPKPQVPHSVAGIGIPPPPAHAAEHTAVAVDAGDHVAHSDLHEGLAVLQRGLVLLSVVRDEGDY